MVSATAWIAVSSTETPRIAESSIPEASGVGTATMLIRRSSSRCAIRLRTVVSVISSDRAISVLLSRPSTCSILIIRRSRSSTRRPRLRTAPVTGSCSSRPILATTRHSYPQLPNGPAGIPCGPAAQPAGRAGQPRHSAAGPPASGTIIEPVTAPDGRPAAGPEPAPSRGGFPPPRRLPQFHDHRAHGRLAAAPDPAPGRGGFPPPRRLPQFHDHGEFWVLEPPKPAGIMDGTGLSSA